MPMRELKKGSNDFIKTLLVDIYQFDKEMNYLKPIFIHHLLTMLVNLFEPYFISGL